MGQDTVQPEFTLERRWFSVSLVAAANLVLHQTVERIHVGKKYGDIPRGIFVVRGENVVLLGEIVSAQLPLQSGPEPGLFVVCLPVCCDGCPAVRGRCAELNRSFLLQDLEKESDTPLQQVSIEEILEEQRVEQQAKQESEKLKVQALKERGLSVPRVDTLDEY